jgi:tetratricopeptide (TPR) repeat protein
MSLPGIASVEQMRQLVAGLEAHHVNQAATGREATEQAWVLIAYALAATNLGDTPRALELAAQTFAMAHRGGAPSTIARANMQIGMTLASIDPDQARRHFQECIDLGRAGVRFSGLGGAYMQAALIDAQQGRHAEAARNMTAAITTCRPAGRNAELDGACGYAVELLELLGDPEAALVIIGSILAGELRVLRDMPAPPSRTPPDVRAMRQRVGNERFAELVTRGARISYDDILDHILASLRAVELSDPA